MAAACHALLLIFPDRRLRSEHPVELRYERRCSTYPTNVDARSAVELQARNTRWRDRVFLRTISHLPAFTSRACIDRWARRSASTRTEPYLVRL